jgi:hypothetical protein
MHARRAPGRPPGGDLVIAALSPRSRTGLIALFVLTCWLVLALVASPGAHAVVNDNSGEAHACPLSIYDFTLDANLVVVGLPVTNSSLRVDATDALLVGDKALQQYVCETVALKIPSFAWSVDAPSGQSASIANGDTLSPTITVGGTGNYRVRFTACPAQCVLHHASKTKTVGPITRDVTIRVLGSAPPAPETLPTLPALPPPQPAITSFPYATRKAECSDGGGIHSPEWVTTKPFHGAGDYRLAEGQVTWNQISTQDNFLNHNSEDFEWKIRPDAPFSGLQGPDEALQHEWETNSLPSFFMPTPPPDGGPAELGDRTSTFGFWIFDCGHDPFTPEIHPPVGLAVERPRPVPIPTSFHPPGYPNGMGSNVLVPGVVADIWFNRNSGGVGACGSTALHQPAHTSLSGCIRQPHPVNRKFTFHVYLPRSPQERARELGHIDVPAVPLYTGTQKLSTGQSGPEPQITVRQQDGRTWLDVTVDLSTLGQATYARRLSVAWAYPQPDNWGASRWEVSLNSIHVYNNADPKFDAGDWRFNFNTNNRDQEWTQVFSCDGCIDSNTTYPLSARTGVAGGDGSGPSHPRGLGPDPIVFPGQPILVHTGGYDEDAAWGDALGAVLKGMPQVGGQFSVPSENADGNYLLNYTLRPVGPVGGATLTPEANALMNSYSAESGANCQPSNPAQHVPPECFPSTVSSALGQATYMLLRNLPIYEGNEREEFALTNISASRLRHEFNHMRSAARRRLLSAIRRHLLSFHRRFRPDSWDLALTLDRALPSKYVRRAVPTNIRRIVVRLQRRRAHHHHHP